MRLTPPSPATVFTATERQIKLRVFTSSLPKPKSVFQPKNVMSTSIWWTSRESDGITRPRSTRSQSTFSFGLFCLTLLWPKLDQKHLQDLREYLSTCCFQNMSKNLTHFSQDHGTGTQAENKAYLIIIPVLSSIRSACQQLFDKLFSLPHQLFHLLFSLSILRSQCCSLIFKPAVSFKVFGRSKIHFNFEVTAKKNIETEN